MNEDSSIINDKNYEEFDLSFCSITKTQNQLIVKIDQSVDSIMYLFPILILGLPTIAIFLLGLLYNIINALIFLLISSAIIIPFIPGYLYYRNRKSEWILNRASKKIIHNKISPKYKRLKRVNFSEIDFLIYHQNNWTGPGPAIQYSLNFFLKNLKQVKICVERKEKCKELGIILAKFLDKSLFYKTYNWREKII
ncbi:MAG: hypothetical protein ACFFAN_19095 [Promethearchaeota archaeon]